MNEREQARMQLRELAFLQTRATRDSKLFFAVGVGAVLLFLVGLLGFHADFPVQLNAVFSGCGALLATIFFWAAFEGRKCPVVNHLASTEEPFVRARCWKEFVRSTALFVTVLSTADGKEFRTACYANGVEGAKRVIQMRQALRRVVAEIEE